MFQALFVIICITPNYKTDVQPPSDALPEARPIQLNARYIYDRLRNEYHNNRCTNKRMVPVLFTETGATYEHVPEFMKSTFAFSFPKDQQSIVNAVLGKHVNAVDLR